MRQGQRKHNHLVPASTAASQMPLSQRPLQATYTNHQMSSQNATVTPSLLLQQFCLCRPRGPTLPGQSFSRSPLQHPVLSTWLQGPRKSMCSSHRSTVSNSCPSQAPLLQAGGLLALPGSSPALVPLSCKPCKLALGKGGRSKNKSCEVAIVTDPGLCYQPSPAPLLFLSHLCPPSPAGPPDRKRENISQAFEEGREEGGKGERWKGRNKNSCYMCPCYLPCKPLIPPPLLRVALAGLSPSLPLKSCVTLDKPIPLSGTISLLKSGGNTLPCPPLQAVGRVNNEWMAVPWKL